MGFGQEDYTQFENLGSVSIEVTKLQGNNEQIIVNIAPLTFAAFANNPNLVLPAELVPIVAGVDPAERKMIKLMHCCTFHHKPYKNYTALGFS